MEKASQVSQATPIFAICPKLKRAGALQARKVMQIILLARHWYPAPDC